MKIVAYCDKYDEDIKDLLLELQEYVCSIDREKYNIITDEYREESFKKTIREVSENNGIIFLAEDDNKIVGFIAGIIIEAENTYEFRGPKTGRVTELIVTKNCRAKGTGKILLDKIEEYFKSNGCKRSIIEVFEYNEMGKNFYYKNDYFNRVIDIMKHI